MKPFSIEEVNDTLSCHIYPNARFPNGLYLTYETCPETYDNKTIKAIRFCCLSIMFLVIEKSVYKQTQDFLRYNSSSVLVGPAVLFNVLSLVVLSKFKRLKGSAQISTTFYMKCLCILDTLTIVSKFVYEVIVVRNGLREHPLVITSFLCKFLGFSECLCAVSAIYVLIAMSIDKLICVLAPLKVSQILTTNKARFIFSCILFSSALMASYNLFDRRVFILNSNLDDDVDHVDTSSSSSSSSNHNHNHNSPPDDSEIIISNHSSSSSSSSSTSNSNSNGATQNNNQQTTTSPNYRISYDCDSNWPELKNDWILINNIVRVFLPILVLCVCNSWIAIALAKARRHTEALFNTNGVSNSNSSDGGGVSKHRRVLSTTSSSIRYEKTKNTRAPPLKLAFYSKYRSKSRSDLESREDEPTSEGAVTSRSLVSNRLLKPASSSALVAKIRKHSADSYISYDSESEIAAKGNIINKLYHQNSRRSGGSGSGNGGSPPHRLSNVADYRGNLMVNSSVPRPSGYINIRAQKNTQHISIMLFAVSIGFVILNLPFAIRTIFHRQYQEDFKIFDYLYHDDNSFITSTSKTEIQTAIKYEFFTTLTHLLLDLNYIANFFLYFFSGSKFRAQLFAMFGCSKKKPGELASNAPTRATAAAVGAKANTPPKFTTHTNNPIVIVHSSSRHTIDRRISSIDNCNSPPSNALDDNEVDVNNNDTNSNKPNNHIKKNQSCARRLFSKCLFFRKSNDSIHHRQKIMKQNQKVRYEEISLTDPKRLSFRQANKNCI